MTAPIVFTVVGHAAPQGSKRSVGNGQMVESSKHVPTWREAVKEAALKVRPPAPLDDALEALVVITLNRPKVAKATETVPAKRPDLSKLLRSTEDALTDAGVYTDDARIVNFARLAKVWHGHDELALDLPGAVVAVAPKDLGADLHQLALDAVAAFNHGTARPDDGWSPW